MALPLIPIALGAGVILLLMQKSSAAAPAKPGEYGQAPADGSRPAVKEPKPSAKSWREMSPALQEQVAAALGALGVSPATGELSGGVVTADAIKLATQTAALCESQGFYDVAKELRRLIGNVAPTVATPASAAPIKAAAPPCLTPAQIEAIARTLTLDRDPKAIAGLILMLEKLPPSPQRDNYIQMAQALLLQLQAAQSTTQTMQQIDAVIKSPGIAEVITAVQALPPVAIPVMQPGPDEEPSVQYPVPRPATKAPVTPAAAVALALDKMSTAQLRAATGTRILKQGVTPGNDIRAWQTMLRRDGFTAVKVDGVYGPKTKTATVAWQKQRGLTGTNADGAVGPKTRAKMGSAPNATRVPTVPAAAASVLSIDKFPDPTPNARTLRFVKGRPNMKGEDVKSWQRILKAFGHNLGTFGPNKDGVDGDFGPTADRETRAFQTTGFTRYRDPRITIDGVVGPMTRRLVLLRTADAKAAVVSGVMRRRIANRAA